MRLNLALVFLCYLSVFGVFGIFGLFCFILSVPVQLIAWEDCSQNDLVCGERDIKHLLTHSLGFSLLEPSSSVKWLLDQCV